MLKSANEKEKETRKLFHLKVNHSPSDGMVVILLVVTPPTTSNGCDDNNINNGWNYDASKNVYYTRKSLNKTNVSYLPNKNFIRHVTRVNISDIYSQVEIDGDAVPVTKEGEFCQHFSFNYKKNSERKTLCIRLSYT